ncbi:M15 family metallopeptidase [Scatolibacter rhodanostii]|uniref:M15 family metallopeptidase n=1 Tax=Scatolibacter rhodanostii TaxID=2014781 RepID=UPI0013565DBF|nr:M15 family metallopeptidase [Scatolibacter rhodanostii]
MNRRLAKIKQERERERKELKTRNRTTFLVVFLVIIFTYLYNSHVAKSKGQLSDTNLITDVSSATTKEETLSNYVNDSFADIWSLILVNKDTPLPSDFEVTLEDVPGGQVDARIAPTLLQMLEDAHNDGVELNMCSGYRSIELQTKIYNENIDYYQNQGYTAEDSQIFTERYVLPPSKSEHHTGLAVDFLTEGYQSLNDDFSQSKAYTWLQEHAANYGFIERYPRDKESITKILWEPWHYRFVGLETAGVISSSDLCLEEYIQQQKAAGT